MKVYVEGLEILPPDSDEEPDFIRVDVTGLTQAEINAVINEVRDLLSGAEHYIIRIHYCHHDEEPKKPCSIRIVEEV